MSIGATEKSLHSGTSHYMLETVYQKDLQDLNIYSRQDVTSNMGKTKKKANFVLPNFIGEISLA